MEQTHEKFKLFRISGINGNFDQAFKQVEEFANQPNLSPKSIGAEFLEKTNELLLTLGYTPATGQSNNIKLKVYEIGKLNENTEVIENKIAEKAKQIKTVICHELFVTQNDDIHMIFMANI